MSSLPDQNQLPPRPIRIIVAVVRVSLPIVVLVVSVGAAMFLLSSRPEAERQDVEIRTTLVETIVPIPGTQGTDVVGYGTVEPHRRLAIQPQVGGQVTELNDAVRAGGILRAGDTILRIDPRDYELSVRQREADVANAAVALQLEEARGLVAAREWELLGESIETSELGRRLARREPQKIEKEAMLEASRGRLEQAELDLERTTIRTPFNSMVLEDSIEIGQVVSPQTRIATLVGTDRFDVIVAIPIDQLPLIMIDPARPERNSVAQVIQELGNGQAITRPARVDRVIGEVERAGRLARVRVVVEDPLGLEDGAASVPLLVGSYVRVGIEGPEVDDVVELPRAVVRDNDSVWLMNVDRELEIRPLEIVEGRPDTVLARLELATGEEIVTSPLPVAIPGMPLERRDAAGRAGSSPETPNQSEPTE